MEADLGPCCGAHKRDRGRVGARRRRCWKIRPGGVRRVRRGRYLLSLSFKAARKATVGLMREEEIS